MVFFYVTMPEISSNYKKIFYLVVILLLPAVFYLTMQSGDHHYTKLPYIGPKEAIQNSDGTYDTNYHQIPYFEFTDQDGNKVTRDDLLGSVYITDFFFATCPTICPKMAGNMKYLQDKFKDKKDLRFISITVNPEHDTVEVLKEYADMVHADTKNWTFLTGDKEKIYDVALKGFFASVGEDEVAPGGFLHTQYFVLVDKKGHIRGLFDGTVYSEMKKDLTDALDILYREEVVPLKEDDKNKVEQLK